MPARAALMSLVLYIVPVPLSAAEVVRWLTADAPPMYIYEGTFTGKGFGDEQLRLLIEAMPDYDHRVIAADSARITYELAHGDGVCVVAAFKNAEREKVAVFSNRPIVVPGYRLLIRSSNLKKMAPFLSKDGAVDLSRLAQSKDLHGAYVAARPLFGIIEEFIKNEDRKVALDKLPQATQLTNLLISNHVDFAFVPGIEVNFYTIKYRTQYAFTALPIQGMPFSAENFVACSSGVLGQEVIGKINRYIDDDQHWRQFVAPLSRWNEPFAYKSSLAQRPIAP